MDTVREFRENRLRPVRLHSSRQLQRGEKLRLMLRREPPPATAGQGAAPAPPPPGPPPRGPPRGCGAAPRSPAPFPFFLDTTPPSGLVPPKHHNAPHRPPS